MLLFIHYFLCPALGTPTAEKGGVCRPYSRAKSAFWDNVEETVDEADVGVCVCAEARRQDGCRLLPAGGPPSHSPSWSCWAPPGAGGELIGVQQLEPGKPAELMSQHLQQSALLLASPEAPAAADISPAPSSVSPPPLPSWERSSPEQHSREEFPILKLWTWTWSTLSNLKHGCWTISTGTLHSKFGLSSDTHRFGKNEETTKKSFLSIQFSDFTTYRCVFK